MFNKPYPSSPWTLNELKQILFKLNGQPVFDTITKKQAAQLIKQHPPEKYSAFISSAQLEHVIKKSKRKKRLPVAFPMEMWDRLAQVATNYRDALFIKFLKNTRFRINEACKSDIENIDRKNKRILVIGKGDVEDFVPIIDNQFWTELLNFVGERKTGPIFINNWNQAWSPKTWQKKIKTLGHRVGLSDNDLKRLTCHKVRHSFGVEAARKGVSVPTIAKALRHGDPATSFIYARFTDEQVRDELIEKQQASQKSLDIDQKHAKIEEFCQRHNISVLDYMAKLD